MVITSLDNPKIKKYLKLKTKKYRDNFKLYLVETDNLIKEAINNNCLVDLLALDGSINKYDFNITYVSKEIIKKLSSLDTTSNFIGVVKMKEMNDNLVSYRRFGETETTTLSKDEFVKNILDCKENKKYNL